MKKQKQIEQLNSARFKVPYRKKQDADAFEEFSRSLRDTLADNLNFKLGQASEFRDSWRYNVEQDHFYFTLSYAFAVEVSGYSIDSMQTKHIEVRATFTFDATATLPLEDLIAGLAEDMRRFAVGLNQARSLQCKHILATEGVEAYEAAVDRTH